MATLRIVIGDDQPLMLDTVRHVLDEDDGMAVVGTARSGADLLEVVSRVKPDIAIVDLTMPPLDGLRCLERLRDEHADVTVVVLSGCDDGRQIDAAFRRGAAAFLLKTMNPFDLPALLRHVVEQSAFVPPPAASARDEPRDALSAREREVLALVAEGLSNKEIAARLWLSQQTVKFHVRNVYRKLGISSRTEALRFAHEHDLVALRA
jgi:DNA-binding NarL/FixJ family response regulator